MTEREQGPEETRHLIAGALEGNPSARTRLLERLRPRIVLWVSSRLSSQLREVVDAEDVAQEILISVHRGLDDFEDRGDRAFFAWLFTIARHRINDLSDYVKAEKRKPIEPIGVSPTTPGQAAIRSEEFERLREALLCLPDDYRRVIELRRLEERDTKEVAAEMDRSENAVRILYYRALQSLRQFLDD
jgi:RNA polymerase sigma-70 factor (ECF subfamily)